MLRSVKDMADKFLLGHATPGKRAYVPAVCMQTLPSLGLMAQATCCLVLFREKERGVAHARPRAASSVERRSTLRYVR